MPEILAPVNGESEGSIIEAAEQSRAFVLYVEHFDLPVESARAVQVNDQYVVAFALANEGDVQIEINLRLDGEMQVVSSRATVEHLDGSEIIGVDTYKIEDGEVRSSRAESV